MNWSWKKESISFVHTLSCSLFIHVFILSPDECISINISRIFTLLLVEKFLERIRWCMLPEVGYLSRFNFPILSSDLSVLSCLSVDVMRIVITKIIYASNGHCTWLSLSFASLRWTKYSALVLKCRLDNLACFGRKLFIYFLTRNINTC